MCPLPHLPFLNIFTSLFVTLRFTLQKVPPNRQILETCFTPGLPHLTLHGPSQKRPELSWGTMHLLTCSASQLKTAGAPSTPGLKTKGICHE